MGKTRDMGGPATTRSCGAGPGVGLLPGAGSVGFADVTRGLVWPLLLRAGGAALRPAHVGLAFFLVVLLILLARVPGVWWAAVGEDRRELDGPGALVDRGVGTMVGWLREGMVWQAVWEAWQMVRDLVTNHPLAMLALVVPLGVLWGVVGGTIARSAAWTAARGERLSWPVAFGQALSLLVSLAGCVVGPVFGIVAMVLALGGAGWVLLDKPQADWRWALAVPAGLVGVACVVGATSGRFKPRRLVAPAVVGLVLAGLLVLPASIASMAGGALFGVGVGVALLAIVLGVVTMVGLPMLTAGVMVEGTDAIDAVQRVWAYIFAMPGRTLAYWMVVGALGVLVVGACGVVLGWATVLTGRLAGMWVETAFAQDIALASGTTGATRVWDLNAPSGEPSPAWHARVVSMVSWWVKVLGLLSIAVLVSYVHCAGAMMYLALRRVCDGQHESDVWDPRVVTKIGAAKLGDDEEDAGNEKDED